MQSSQSSTKGTTMKRQRTHKRHHTKKVLPAEPLFTLFHDYPTNRQIADALRKSSSTIQQWRKQGIPIYQADEVACHIGLHPSHIWGEQWWNTAETKHIT